MKAALLVVGSELLGSERVDTNALKMAASLESYGVDVSIKLTLPDNRNAIADALRLVLRDNDIALISGGLGPTEDDVTKEAVADALGLTLERDDAIVKALEERFAKRGYKMPETNVRQAMIFAGQQTLANPRGTAPGFHLTATVNEVERHVWIFPGVPYELAGMLEHDLERWLGVISPDRIYRRVLRIAGVPESHVDELLQPFYKRYPDFPVGILAGKGELQIHLRVPGARNEAPALLAQYESEIREILGDRIYGSDNDTIEIVVGRLLSTNGASVATAESCTGGMLGSRITDVSGSSAYYLGGIVAYTRDAKLFLLGVDPAAIDAHGEVSEEVARQMATGARRRFGTTYGIGITGIAGPTGGSDEKPVGTVQVAVAGPAEVNHRKFVFPGDRQLVKQLSVLTGLNMLRLMLERS